MQSLKLFKVSEILHVATFDIICSSKFASNCVHNSLPTPLTLPPPWKLNFVLEISHKNYLFYTYG
jgi:hypothetical protein